MNLEKPKFSNPETSPKGRPEKRETGVKPIYKVKVKGDTKDKGREGKKGVKFGNKK